MRTPKQTWSQNPAASGVLNLKGKKITVMGINPEGRGVQDAEFLARHGAKIVATDKKNGIEIKTDETIFLALAPKIVLVGVTGTKGKSTVSHLIYEILKSSGRPILRVKLRRAQRVFLAGNVRGQAALPLLDEVKEGDVIIMELDSWKLQGFGDAK